MAGAAIWPALVEAPQGESALCGFHGTVRAHREHHRLGRNDTATRASMGGRTLSYIEDGQLKATPQIIGRIHTAIDSLADKGAERAHSH